MTVHVLRCWLEFYRRLERGEKTWELRKDDRGYEAGDALLLYAYSPSTAQRLGEQLVRIVTAVDGPNLPGNGEGLAPGYVLLSLREPTPAEVREAIESLL